MNKYRYPSLNNLRRIPNTRIPSVSVSFVSAIEETGSEPPQHGTYGELLFDERWRNKRAQILNRDNSRCVICTNDEELQVHHRQYHYIKEKNQFKPPWDYSDHLLITLCKSCHNRGHSKFKVPTLSI